MKKLKLNLDDVVVASMETGAIPDDSGTVFANSDFCSLTCSCWPNICPPGATRIVC